MVFKYTLTSETPLEKFDGQESRRGQVLRYRKCVENEEILQTDPFRKIFLVVGIEDGLD